MHKAIAENLATDIKTALTTYGPVGMRKVFNEINKVLWDTFGTEVYLVTPGCDTCEYTLVDKAYKKVSKKIKEEFRQAYEYSHWDHLDKNLFCQALDRLIYNIYGALTFETPKAVYICRSQPGSNPNSTYVTQWAGETRYGLYVKVVQIDGSVKEFDLLETYKALETN